MRTVSPSGDDLRRFCTLSGLGELDPETVCRHAPDALLLDEEAGTPVGRASLWWRTAPNYGDERVGLIGHFAVVDGVAASRILDAACALLADNGCTLAVGPMDGSTWRRYRLLTERGTEPTFFLEPDNPDDWPGHFERADFRGLAHYYSARCADLGTMRTADAVALRLRKYGFTVRPIDLARIDSELTTLWSLATDAFADNFLYTPITEEEFRAMYMALLPVLLPELVLIAEHEGRAVGFGFAVPDVMQTRRGLPVDTLVFKTIGVAKCMNRRGIGKWIFDCTLQAARTLGFQSAIYALIHADNPSGRLAHPSGRDFRRYTLFARKL